MAKYTIILPVKNGGSYVKECVGSILSQTYSAFELVVLENSSTDGTAEWLATISDSRVTILPAEKPLTIAENWGRIIRVQKNEFMTLIGHDDVLLPHYLEEMERLIEKHPTASLYQSHFSFIDATGEVIRHCLPMDEVQSAPELLACLTTRTLDSMGTGYMFRSKDYDALGGISPAYPDLLFADNVLWVSLAAKSYKVTTFRTCFLYRLHQSLSRTTKGMDYYTSFTQYMKFLQKEVAENVAMKEVVERYGKTMLYELCEGVAHRLLKTPVAQRNLTVKQFVQECIGHASLLIPEQLFEPLSKKRIRMAVAIDENTFLRKLFQGFRKHYRKPI
ncbi:MAG: glycosyltransferase family 2 protein [Sphingobacteriaceae bacterium]|nr:MAG: glycosyltransferase family 2 protein [Sphingobacteriaceae bacterium]